MLRQTDEAFKRLIEEREEVKERLSKLTEFIIRCRRNEIRDISLDEIHLLEEQEEVMTKYMNVLNTRIYRVKGCE